MLLSAQGIAAAAKPGQFLQVKVSDNTEPLLRRPFSIHNVKSGQIEILYEILGKGTEALAQKAAGAYLDCIGPLGNGFEFRTPYPAPRNPILVAGGMGIAPLFFLAQRLSKGKTLVLLGAKNKKQILCEKELRRLGCRVMLATDDGSKGFKGKVTDLLRHLISAIDHRPSAIYACGPRPMLKEIARISQTQHIPAQASLEEHMACGIGACLGCVVNTRQGFKRVCKDGPVFQAEEIIW